MREEVCITFPDGSKTNVAKGTTFYDIAKIYQPQMENPILGAKVDNAVVPLDHKILTDQKVTFFDLYDLTGYKMYQAGLKFVLEVALKETFGKIAQVCFSHSIARGMVANIDVGRTFLEEDVHHLQAKMNEIIAKDERIYKLNTYKENAIYYYNSCKEFEKSANIHNITNDVVTYHKLRDLYNYYYVEMPYATGVLIKFELVYLEPNKIAILYPNAKAQESLPVYLHYQKIMETFQNGKRWLGKLGIPYIANINQKISEGNIENIIRVSEIEFDLQVNKAVEEVISNKNIKFVMVAGPSSSGKTTCTKKLALNFIAKGYDPIVISVDDYFLNRDETPKDKDGNYDFECLEAIDLKLLNRNLLELQNGGQVDLPSFNFLTGKREYHDRIVRLKENSIILMEGLHCLNDALTPDIKKENKYKIYLSPFIPLNIDRHNYISTTDLRMIRRMIRDNRTRGNDVSETISYWQHVRDGEEKYIFPYIDQTNIVINTALVYEVNVLRVYAEPLLYSVKMTSPFYEEARRLINFLKMFFPIPSELVSKDSILREFMGNGSFE